MLRKSVLVTIVVSLGLAASACAGSDPEQAPKALSVSAAPWQPTVEQPYPGCTEDDSDFGIAWTVYGFDRSTLQRDTIPWSPDIARYLHDTKGQAVWFIPLWYCPPPA